MWRHAPPRPHWHPEWHHLAPADTTWHHLTPPGAQWCHPDAAYTPYVAYAAAGAMFWFAWNRFFGSYFRLTSASRA